MGFRVSLWSESGTYEKVKHKFWPWLAGRSPSNLARCSLFAWKRQARTMVAVHYRGSPLTRKRTSLGPYRRPMPRVLRESSGGGRFLMGEIPLHPACAGWKFAGDELHRGRT